MLDDLNRAGGKPPTLPSFTRFARYAESRCAFLEAGPRATRVPPPNAASSRRLEPDSNSALFARGRHNPRDQRGHSRLAEPTSSASRIPRRASSPWLPLSRARMSRAVRNCRRVLSRTSLPPLAFDVLAGAPAKETATALPTARVVRSIASASGKCFNRVAISSAASLAPIALAGACLFITQPPAAGRLPFSSSPSRRSICSSKFSATTFASRFTGRPSCLQRRDAVARERRPAPRSCPVAGRGFSTPSTVASVSGSASSGPRPRCLRPSPSSATRPPYCSKSNSSRMIWPSSLVHFGRQCILSLQ